MALRYDLTAPLARFVAENWDNLPKPFRRYSIGPVWRNEKPGPGRFREFLQCDADTVGSPKAAADAEIIAMMADGLIALGLGQKATIRMNNRKLLNGLLSSVRVTEYSQILSTLRAIDKLDRLGLDAVKSLLGEGRLDESGDFTRGAQLFPEAIDRVLEFLTLGADSRSAMINRIAGVIGSSEEGDSGLTELDRINSALKMFGVSEEIASFDPGVVRGLEYYTGVVFESELKEMPTDSSGRPVRFGAITSGGRYDGLIERFGGKPVPATGVSFGVSRLAAAMKLSGAFGSAVRGPIVVLSFDERQMPTYCAIAAELRAAGIAAEVYLGTAGMKAQLKYADRRSSPAAIMAGDDELATNSITIKDLDLGRELSTKFVDSESWRAARPGQITVPREALVAAI